MNSKEGCMMPYRDVRPRKRPWWDKLTALYFVSYVLIGIAGVPWPSASLQSALGRENLLYGAGCLIFGALALRAWQRGSRRAEARAMYALVALTIIHATVILIETGYDGMQTALRLYTATIGLAAWIGTRQAFGISRDQMSEAIAQIDEKERAKRRG